MRLDQLQEHFGDRIRVDWKSFLLRAEPKTGDRQRFIEYTESWLRPAEAEPETEFTVWSSDEDQPASSIPAQVAFKTVEAIAPELKKAYHDRLLRGYFAENRNIGNSDVLIELAVDVGVDEAALEHAGRERRDELTQLVIDEHNGAIANNVTGIPTVVFEGQFPVPGAQPLSTYIDIVERIEGHLAQ